MPESGDLLLRGVLRDVQQARDGSRSVSCHRAMQDPLDSETLARGGGMGGKNLQIKNPKMTKASFLFRNFA